MKQLLVILLFVVGFDHLCKAQDSALVCFKKQEALVMANKVKTMQVKLLTYDTLVNEQRSLIGDLEHRIGLKDTMIAAQSSQISLYKLNDENHRMAEAALRQELAANRKTWIDSPLLWLGIGLVTGYLTTH